MKEANYPYMYAYECDGYLFSDHFISRSIGILSDATGYDERELFTTWREYENYRYDRLNFSDEKVLSKDIFIDFVITTLECDW